MKSDLSRDTFDPGKHFTRVIMQQGRVTLDADHNEQVSILLHYLRTLARDLLGPGAAPQTEGGFVLGPPPAGSDGIFAISKGRYYVDGMLVENEADTTYAHQVDLPLADDDPLRSNPGADRPAGPFLAYLDVWERHVTPIEDATIRELALGGPDTCNRAKVVWQVRLAAVPKLNPDQQRRVKALTAKKAQLEASIAAAAGPARKKLEGDLRQVEAQLAAADVAGCDAVVGQLPRLSSGVMAARLDPGREAPDPCVMPPDSKYRGAENQLYRVEIHTPGPVGTATFKWSRDNGSVVTAWAGAGSGAHELEVHSTRGFEAGDWAELSTETLDLQGLPGTLVKLVKVEAGVLTVDPTVPDAALTWMGPGAKVRRWNQTETEDEDSRLHEGAVPITAPDPADKGGPEWIDLEDGIQVRFGAGEFRTGDFWLIPARVATGTIEWPDLLTPPGQSEQPPHGVEHHYAPLGYVAWDDKEKAWGVDNDCRCEFAPLECVAPGAKA